MIVGNKPILKWSDIKMSELDLTKLISHFGHSNKAEGKSPKTVSWYTEMLFDFVKFLRSTGREAILAELNTVAVREFIVHEQDRGVSPYTTQGKVRSLKAFASWLLREGYTAESILSNIKLPKVPIKIIEPLTPAEIDLLISAQNPLTALGCRDIAILVTLLDTGIRLSELSNLRSEDAHVEEGYLRIMGKGSKERLVPVGALAQKVIWRYLFHFRPKPATEQDNYLFLTLYGARLSSEAIKLILKRWGKRSGVPRLHAHLCRHTYATNFLTEKCGDVLRLKMILGHSSLEMVNRYVHFASAQDMIQNRVSSPIDHMNLKRLRGYKIDRLIKARNNNSESFDP
jgi:site-specific recombinase XerD